MLGCMLSGPASLAPTVPLISWHWQGQEQQKASPGWLLSALHSPGQIREREGNPVSRRRLRAHCPRPGSPPRGCGLCPLQGLLLARMFLSELAWQRGRPNPG